MKVSSSPPRYSTSPIYSTEGSFQSSFAERANDLYGESYFERFIKDYNGQTTWVTVNVHSFLPKDKHCKIPKWLNVAIGYGGDNMYGAYGNFWENEEGARFVPDPVQYQRYRQFYLSFDVDLDRIPSNKPLVKTLLNLVNWIKIPSPSLEINTLGQMKFHPIYW